MEDKTESVQESRAVRAPVSTRQGLAGAFTLVPQSFNQAMQVAELLAQSQFVPQSFRGKPGDVLAAIMYGAEVGLGPMISVQSIAVINGRPALWGDAVMALLLSHPKFDGLHEEWTGEGDNLTAVCELQRKGITSPFFGTFSVADAKKAGLLGKTGTWSAYPRDMLMWKARHRAIRQGFADMLKGLMMAEDIQGEWHAASRETEKKSKVASILDAKVITKDAQNQQSHEPEAQGT